jgi:16S rRNA (adenine1518-N6/adenine1519-N6)-dimethyltransferase
MARQRLGQHFLADENWREEIARAIGVSPHSSLIKPPADPQNSCWIEIGAGHGEMTQHLLATGLPVYAIELDEPLAQRLRHLAKKSTNLIVVHADVLRTDLRQLAAGRRIHLYGNLPYYITSPILQHLFVIADSIAEIHIVIQDEVALRLAAAPDSSDYGYLSVLTQLYTRPEYVFQIPREAFSPPPAVASALVTLRLTGQRANLGLATKDETAFLDFVKLCFSKKRKTLVNNLRSIAEPETIRRALAAQHLRPDARAEQLSLAHFAALRFALAQTPFAKK